MKTKKSLIAPLFLLTSILVTAAGPRSGSSAQTDDPTPPDEVVKLIFIHHSTGENWLTDNYGDLGVMLGQNQYFVSDTNYGWGPDSIGDRTDIPGWLAWFRSEDSPTYMQALFSESGMNSSFTRNLSDPGGENDIVMFKSCFPNSDLEGSPDDSPSPDGWLTVGHAKYVYNEILQYFSTRPDKLFIVITAPPLSDATNAANARAFNQWLVNDWLSENNYQYHNVAVFDFYNVLTGPDGHHTFRDGQEVHTIAVRNTLTYPSGDDHPSEQGSRKATNEFIPLLNFFYNRWMAEAPSQPPVLDVTPPASDEPVPQATSSSELSLPSGLIDNFEAGVPIGTSGWEPFWQETAGTAFECTTTSVISHNGEASLQMDFNIAPDSWATCALEYDDAQNWSDGKGISFYVHTNDVGQVFDVNIYVEGPDGRENYFYSIEALPGSAAEWSRFDLAWNEFHRVAWEADAGAPFTKPDQIIGMAFGFDRAVDGTLWIDDIEVVSQPGSAPNAESEDSPADDADAGGGSPLPCLSGFAPLALVLGVFVAKPVFKRRRS